MLRFVLLGLLVAITGEAFDNFVVNHRPAAILLVIVPLYAAFFIALFFLHKLPLPKRIFCLIMGAVGLVFIENIALQKAAEPWPIQIFMFSWWFSIASYPVLFANDSRGALFFALPAALAGSVITSFVSHNTFLTLAVFQFVFWIVSAIGNFFYLKEV